MELLGSGVVKTMYLQRQAVKRLEHAGSAKDGYFVSSHHAWISPGMKLMVVVLVVVVVDSDQD